VARVVDGEPSTAAANLRTLTRPAVLDRAADTLLNYSIDAVAYASTTSAYVIGRRNGDGDPARVARRRTGGRTLQVVVALRVLAVERIALIGAPWFEPELNDLGAAYFRSQGFDVVSSRSAALSQDPAEIEPSMVLDWATRHVPDSTEAVFIGGNGFRAAAAIGSLERAIARPGARIESGTPLGRHRGNPRHPPDSR
jgi:maleate isomerase